MAQIFLLAIFTLTPNISNISNTRLQRRLQQIEKLAPTEKRQILQIIDAFIEREQLKKRVQTKRAG